MRTPVRRGAADGFIDVTFTAAGKVWSEGEQAGAPFKTCSGARA
jgi:hypothetical protein